MWVNLPFVHPDGMVFVVSMHIPNNEGVLILLTLYLKRGSAVLRHFHYTSDLNLKAVNPL